MSTIEASKLLDHTIEQEEYSNKLLIAIQNIYRARKINIYDYERMINLLTCHMLINDKIRNTIRSQIEKDTIARINQIDIRV